MSISTARVIEFCLIARLMSEDFGSAWKRCFEGLILLSLLENVVFSD